MGLIGSGPTFLGTVVGHQFTSDPMSVAFLTLAAGSILYGIIQLLNVTHKARSGKPFTGAFTWARLHHRHGRQRCWSLTPVPPVSDGLAPPNTQ